MGHPMVEEVFKRSGVPTFTYVRPAEFTRVMVFLRTPGRGVIIEGPSGIGKTTCVTKALAELQIGTVTTLNARKRHDKTIITALPESSALGIVIIDDFHRLDDELKGRIADFLKTLADEEPPDSKLVLMGINSAGEALLRFAPDLGGRIDAVRFGPASLDSVLDVIEKGEQALNIELVNRQEIADDAQGSFQMAQRLCAEACMLAGVTERPDQHTELNVSIETLRDKVLLDLAIEFLELARQFATGPRLEMRGRHPYLQMLHWLSRTPDWTLRLDEALAKYPTHRSTVGRIIERGNLEKFLRNNPQLNQLFHYDPVTKALSIENPGFQYYLRHLNWSKFSQQVGFSDTEFKSPYDFALSFAGADRTIATKLARALEERGAGVFLDRDHQYTFLGRPVEDVLAPIYNSGAEFILPIAGAEYDQRYWTKFEQDQFQQRFGEYNVIPIAFSNLPLTLSRASWIGRCTISYDADLDNEVDRVADELMELLAARRRGELEEPPLAARGTRVRVRKQGQ